MAADRSNAGPYREAGRTAAPAARGRAIPVGLRVRLLLGGLWAQAGWVLLALGLALVPALAGAWRHDARALLGFAIAPMGAAIVATCWLRGRRVLSLLGRGKPVRARLLERKNDYGAMSVDLHRFLLTFEYRVDGGAYRLVVQTADPEALLAGPQQVCYHPTAPEHARLMAELPGQPRIDGDDRLADEGGGMLALVLPVLGLLASGFAVLAQVLA